MTRNLDSDKYKIMTRNLDSDKYKIMTRNLDSDKQLVGLNRRNISWGYFSKQNLLVNQGVIAKGINGLTLS